MIGTKTKVEVSIPKTLLPTIPRHSFIHSTVHRHLNRQNRLRHNVNASHLVCLFIHLLNRKKSLAMIRVQRSKCQGITALESRIFAFLWSQHCCRLLEFGSRFYHRSPQAKLVDGITSPVLQQRNTRSNTHCRGCMSLPARYRSRLCHLNPRGVLVLLQFRVGVSIKV